MRLLFMGEYGICLAKISMVIHNEDDNTLWFSIDDTSLAKSEIVLNNVNMAVAKSLITELFTTGMLDISNLGLHVDIC